MIDTWLLLGLAVAVTPIVAFVTGSVVLYYLEMSKQRKLQEIYNAIESYRFQNALQCANQILKKAGGKGGGDKDLVLTAKALKALALTKMDKTSEAKEIIEEVKQASSLDEATLQALTACCREMGNYTDIAQLYDVAVKSNPNNEEMASQLFMSLVRLKDYKKQQQVATAMFKNFKKNPYYYWSVMSIVLQALEARGTSRATLAEKMFLPLAEKMMDKAISEKRMETEALRLYLMILELQEKYDQYLEVLTSDENCEYREKGPLLPLESDRQRYKASILFKMKNWNAAYVTLKKMIELDPDEWSNYTRLIEVVRNSADSPSPELKIENVETFIKDNATRARQGGGSKLARGPFLGCLELRKHQNTLGADVLDVEQLQKELLEYVKLFGSKLCCFSDVRAYIALVPSTSRKQFLDNLKEQLPKASAEDSIEQQAKKAQCHICVVQIQNYLGLAATSQDREEIISDLLKRYEDITPLGKDKEETEWQYSDPYALIVTQNLYHLYEDSGDASYLYRAALMLEKATSASKHNAQLRLLAVKIYILLGAAKEAWKHWEACDVKQIQLDSIGYIMADHLVYLGDWVNTETMFSHSAFFFKNTNLEFSEWVVNAYRYGSFGKIIEFQKFQDRIKRSMQSSIIQLETQHFLLLKDNQSCWIPANLATIPTDESLLDLSDNRDLDAMDVYSEYPEEMKSQTLKGRELWARYRRIQLDCWSAIATDRVDLLEGLVTKIKDIFEQGIGSVLKLNNDKNSTCFPHGIQYPRESLFGQYLRFGIDLEIFLAAMNVARDVTYLRSSPQRGSELESSLENIKNHMSTVIRGIDSTLVRDSISSVLKRVKSLDSLLQNDIELLMILCEQIVAPVLVAKDMLKDLSANQTNAGKKENKQARQTREKLRDVMEEYGQQLNDRTKKLIAFVDIQRDGEDMSDMFAKIVLSDRAKEEQTVKDILAATRESKQFSLKNISSILKQMAFK